MSTRHTTDDVSGGMTAMQRHGRLRLQPRGVPVFELLVLTLLAALFVPWERVAGWFASDAADRGRAYAYAVVWEHADPYVLKAAEIVVFDPIDYSIDARLVAGDEPALLPHPDGTRLYVLDTVRDGDGFSGHRLRSIDTRTWETIVTTSVASRTTYPNRWPPKLALSADGERLALRGVGDGMNEWVAVHDATTLEPVAGTARVPLPSACGGDSLLSTTMHLVVLCGHLPIGSSDPAFTPPELALHFIDIDAMRVVATVPLERITRVVGITAGPNAAGGESVHVVFAVQRVVEVDATTFTVLRDVAVPGLERMDVLQVAGVVDGELFIAVRDAYAPADGPSLRRFALPSLDLLGSMPLTSEHTYAPGPGQTVYQWRPGVQELQVHSVAAEADAMPSQVIQLGSRFTHINTVIWAE